MGDNPSVVVLLERAAGGDESAWHGIVRRFTPLVRSVCRRHGLAGVAAEDVGGVVWLHLVGGLTTIREPAALPGWLATVTRRECLALLRRQRREIPLEDQDIAGPAEPPADARLCAQERRIAVREALDVLSVRDQRLLSMLFSDPPTPYAEISATLGMPVGAIGPTRQRCLVRMRRCPALAALMAAEVHSGRRPGPPSAHRGRCFGAVIDARSAMLVA
jgi:RNA polymerase sigma factor (sigma-70 family)